VGYNPPSEPKDRPPRASGLNPEFADVVRTKQPYPSQFLPGVSNASHWVRRCKVLLHAYLDDLGGIDATSEAERTVIRRAAVLVIECERLERRFALVPPEKNVSFRELQMYSTLSNSLRRLLDMTGLERRGPKTLIPTIDAYVQAHSDDRDNTDEADADYVDVPDPLQREAAE